MPISQAGMSILEEKISPFSNLKTVITVLEMYGLTRNTGSVTFYGCDSCFCVKWIPLPGDSQLLCCCSNRLISDGSLFICNWLTHLFQKEWNYNLSQTNATSLTQKWLFTCHLVFAGPSTKTNSWGWECVLLWVGSLFSSVSVSCRNPNPTIPPGTSRWAPVLG